MYVRAVDCTFSTYVRRVTKRPDKQGMFLGKVYNYLISVPLDILDSILNLKKIFYI